jgi:hypothetical protein
MKCIECGKDFEATRVTARFCSGGCRLAFHRKGVSVTESPLALQDDLSVAEVGVPAGVVDIVADLGLDLKKDLGVTSWTADGIFIRDDITVDQVQNIARLVHAKHGRPCPEFRECR